MCPSSEIGYVTELKQFDLLGGREYGEGEEVTNDLLDYHSSDLRLRMLWDKISPLLLTEAVRRSIKRFLGTPSWLP